MKTLSRTGLQYLLALLFVLPLSTFAADHFPAQQAFAGANLSLNGKGIRTKLIFNLYTAGLYLAAPSKDANAILAASQPMAIRLEITSGMITSENMEQAVREGFQKSAGASANGLKAKIEQLITVFKQPIKEGDIYDFVYRPQNLSIIKNGQSAAVIAGADFKQAFFGIWLGNNPAQASLKTALLGGE